MHLRFLLPFGVVFLAACASPRASLHDTALSTSLPIEGKNTLPVEKKVEKLARVVFERHTSLVRICGGTYLEFSEPKTLPDGCEESFATAKEVGKRETFRVVKCGDTLKVEKTGESDEKGGLSGNF